MPTIIEALGADRVLTCLKNGTLIIQHIYSLHPPGETDPLSHISPAPHASPGPYSWRNVRIHWTNEPTKPSVQTKHITDGIDDGTINISRILDDIIQLEYIDKDAQRQKLTSDIQAINDTIQKCAQKIIEADEQVASANTALLKLKIKLDALPADIDP